MHEDLIRRLRERRMLACDGLMTGVGRAHSKMMWVTAEPDPDCAAAADALERSARMDDAAVLVTFKDCGNYRGNLQAKTENGVFFWRVDCDVDNEPWHPIPEYLWNALVRFSMEMA